MVSKRLTYGHDNKPGVHLIFEKDADLTLAGYERMIVTVIDLDKNEYVFRIEIEELMGLIKGQKETTLKT